MKALSLLTALALSLPSIALAYNPERIVCDSEDGKTTLVVENIKLLPAQQVTPDMNMEGSVLIVKVDGIIRGDRIQMVGDTYETAAGPAYDFTGPDGYAVSISAVASHSYSDLQLGKRHIAMHCE